MDRGQGGRIVRDKVAVELESYGELRNGRVYNNEYRFAMTLRDAARLRDMVSR